MINATQEYFMKTNNEQKLRIITCTANATLLIGETTIHYLLGLLINKHDIVRPNLITNICPTIEFIIVDEISMVVCNMLFTMHLKLQN